MDLWGERGQRRRKTIPSRRSLLKAWGKGYSQKMHPPLWRGHIKEEPRCTKPAIDEGAYGRGAKKTICSRGGCTNHAREDGVYWTHGAKLNQAGGVCIRRGAKTAAKKRCSHQGCTNCEFAKGMEE